MTEPINIATAMLNREGSSENMTPLQLLDAVREEIVSGKVDVDKLVIFAVDSTVPSIQPYCCGLISVFEAVGIVESGKLGLIEDIFR